MYTDANAVQEYLDAKTEECRALIRDLTATSLTDGQTTANLVLSFPNPVNHTLHPRAAAQNNISFLRLFTTEGRLVREISVRNTVVDLDVGDLADGLYLARLIFAKGHMEGHRFVKR